MFLRKSGSALALLVVVAVSMTSAANYVGFSCGITGIECTVCRCWVKSYGLLSSMSSWYCSTSSGF